MIGSMIDLFGLLIPHHPTRLGAKKQAPDTYNNNTRIIIIIIIIYIYNCKTHVHEINTMNIN